jgi:hypothetical protein
MGYRKIIYNVESGKDDLIYVGKTACTYLISGARGNVVG